MSGFSPARPGGRTRNTALRGSLFYLVSNISNSPAVIRSGILLGMDTPVSQTEWANS